MFLGVWLSPLSITPNSLVEKPVGDGFSDEPAVTLTLALRLTSVEAEPFSGGEEVVEVRLDIRGIFVGVSLARPELAFEEVGGGPSLPSLSVWELLVATVPTEGEPAMVGSWFRPRRDESDCFASELAVCDISREDEEGVRVAVDEGGVDKDEFDDFSRATLCAVAGSKADICMGGRLMGDLGFRGSVAESVYGNHIISQHMMIKFMETANLATLPTHEH